MNAVDKFVKFTNEIDMLSHINATSIYFSIASRMADDLPVERVEELISQAINWMLSRGAINQKKYKSLMAEYEAEDKMEVSHER